MAINQITTMRLPDGREIAFVDWLDQPLFSCADLLAGFTDSEIPIFNYGDGDEVSATANATVQRVATASDTNISSPSEMNSTEEMLIYAIRPEIHEFNAVGTDLTTILGATGITQSGAPMPTVARLAILNWYLRFELKVSEQVVHSAGLGYYNSGMGPAGQTRLGQLAHHAAPDLLAESVDAGRSSGTSGVPSIEAVRNLSIPLSIGGQEKFEARLFSDRDVAVPSGMDEANPPVNSPTVVHSIRIYFDGLHKRPVS